MSSILIPSREITNKHEKEGRALTQKKRNLNKNTTLSWKKIQRGKRFYLPKLVKTQAEKRSLQLIPPCEKRETSLKEGGKSTTPHHKNGEWKSSRRRKKNRWLKPITLKKSHSPARQGGTTNEWKRKKRKGGSRSRRKKYELNYILQNWRQPKKSEALPYKKRRTVQGKEKKKGGSNFFKEKGKLRQKKERPFKGHPTQKV